MLQDKTTTMGDEEAVMMDRPFQSMNAVERTSAKLSACVMVCRALARCGERTESMTGEDRKVGRRGLQKMRFLAWIINSLRGGDQC